MNKRLAEIASRRQRLLEKIESQRTEVAIMARRWEGPLTLVGAGVAALRILRNHPILAYAGVAMLLTRRRKGIFNLMRQGWRLLGPYSSPLSLILQVIFPAARLKRWLRNAGQPNQG